MKHSSEKQEPTGWHNRGYLPHYDGGEIWQFVTFHLGDSLPQNVLAQWQQNLDNLTPETEEKHLILRRKIESYLDQGYGQCFLADERIANLIQSALLNFEGERYKLFSWVVMPNHVHLLLKPQAGFTLSSIVHSIKSFTASRANKLLQRKGKFWQEDYFDRYIRDREHFDKTVRYIERNPLNAGLCQTQSEWRFSSVWFKKYKS